MRNYFISYHHKSDFKYLKELREKFENLPFSDYGFKDEDLSESSKHHISRKIQYRIWASSVTIILVGEETGDSAWVDWEIWYSLRKLQRQDFPNIKSNPKGIIAVLLPSKRHNIPKRLRRNIESGYAHEIHWHEIDVFFNEAIVRAHKTRKSTELIKNRLTLKLLWHRIKSRN